MKIQEFFANYKNHPVLFIGTGISLRYLNNAYTWDGLLKRISFDLYGNNEHYLDIKASCDEGGKYKYEKIASILEEQFNNHLRLERNGKFELINNVFYENMEKGINLSRMKIYISYLLKDLDVREEKRDELTELKKIRKNIGSIITTNYDRFIETTFEFNPLMGNDILLSNPYGSVYKIHGCVSDAAKIIITADDYGKFNERYELIRAQLLSLFIHNPIIFLGYNIGDENIKDILKTIFTYVEPNTDKAKEIRQNFLLVEYEKDSTNEVITEHDIDIEGFSTIRINKLKTDNYTTIYSALSELHLPISAMDVRKVQGIVNEIYSGGTIKVHITEDLDSLKNGDRIIAIGSSKTISYQYQTVSETIQNYFNIIDEANYGVLTLIDKYSLQSNQFFPIFGFSLINKNIIKSEGLKKQQNEKLASTYNDIHDNCKTFYTTISSILDDDSIAETYKPIAIFWALYNDQLDLDEVESFLRLYPNKKETPYRKLLCLYDFKKYS